MQDNVSQRGDGLLAPKYRIERHTENRWWDYSYPPPGWWLIRGDRVQVATSWEFARRAMWRDIKKRQRRRVKQVGAPA